MSQRVSNLEPPATLEVSQLPTYAFGSRSLMWWGTAGLMLIEGTVFAIVVMTYFYLRTHATKWPMSLPPDLLWGSINTLLMLLSALPNEWTKRAAERRDLPQVRIGMVVCIVLAVAFIVVRWFEYQMLNVRWDSNAYGSVVWMLLSLHTAHVVTDLADSIVLAALMFTTRIEGRRFVDVSENAVYWYFVVLSWLPIYIVLYWVPRW